MTKTDWIDYFEAVNGRTPTELEIAQALVAGEIKDESGTASQVDEPEEEVVELTETVDSAPEVVETHPDPNQPEPAQETAEAQEPHTQQATRSSARPVNQIQNQLHQIQQNQQFNEMKAQGLNYFHWFVGVLKNPAKALQESNFIYSLVTIGLAAAMLGLAIINAFNRLLFSTANLSVAGQSLAQESPEDYARYSEVIRQQFGFSKIMTISLYLFALYAIVTLLPALVQKLTKADDKSLKESFSHNVLLLPAVTVVNILALGISFLIPTSLNISSQYMSRIQSLAMSLSNGSFSDLNQLFTEIPALATVKNAMTYILYCVLIGFVLLLVSVVKRSKGSFAKLHDLYVSVATVVVFLLVVYVIDSKIVEAILGSFATISTVLNNGF